MPPDFTPDSTARTSFVLVIVALVVFAPLRFAPVRFAPVRIALVKFAPRRSFPVRFLFVRLQCERSAPGPGTHFGAACARATPPAALVAADDVTSDAANT